MGSNNSAEPIQDVEGFRIVHVATGSPAEDAGLESFFDYVTHVLGEPVPFAGGISRRLSSSDFAMLGFVSPSLQERADQGTCTQIPDCPHRSFKSSCRIAQEGFPQQLRDSTNSSTSEIYNTSTLFVFE
jgi:hypothetical protein